ncbi:MAG: LytR C-terminal domain-containing protein [bacterium]|nr:LytR C-terminal domain-containing protein [bacterium]
MPKSDSRSPLIIAAIIGLVIIALAIFSAISFFANGDESNPSGLTDSETEELVEAVKSHLNLPTNEDPIIGEITDANALVAQQAFYQGSKNGDYLLIFPENQKAVLYDAKNDILINVGPIVIEQEASSTAEIEFDGKVTIDVRNGSETAGAAGSLADDLRENENYEIGEVGNAANSDYEQTVIVVLNPEIPDSVITELADELSASVSAEIPVDEKDSDADILVIIV